MRVLVIYSILAFIMTQCPLEEHRFTASVNPPGTGTVSTDTAYYRDMVTIEVQAVPNEGWEFAGWSGDTASTENPLIFTITEETDLVANFQRPEAPLAAFTEELTISDGKNSSTLFFGMQEGSTSGFDPSADIEAPPAPPGGSFYAFFRIEGYNLRGDMRPVTRDEVVWALAMAPEEGEGPVRLSWDLSSTRHVGSLTLADSSGSPAVEIDMKSENNYEVDDSVNRLYLISN
ncbi:hypothetical protein [Halalkalibaculum sp. DA384]|uniref:InlB B-repeat-containing protein n=1 Tax=Halalkalibaculum sp. DA384 TaxID=3373606 RepID=UPI0037550A7C